jgi:hypothetical protein
MKKLIVAIAAALTLALAGTASAALVPGVFDPDSTGCPVATYAAGVLHLEKNCPTATNASAGAEITGLEGQTFTSASFTLANTSQCQGGSPRFNVFTTDGTFFLGCNNVIPSGNTYTFDAATIAAGGNQVPVPTGTITGVEVLIDVQGIADLSNITVNGIAQPLQVGPPTSKDQCKKGGWQTFNNPTFKNQGQCVSFVNHANHAAEKAEEAKHQTKGKDKH